MKTTYVPKGKPIESNVVKPSEPLGGISLVNTFKEVVSIKNIKEEAELAKFQEAIQENSREEVLRAEYEQELANKKTISKPNKKKKKSKKKLVIILSILTVLTVGGCLGGFYLYSSSKPTTEDISVSINSFYTSDSKVDVKGTITQSDVDSVYIELQGIKKDANRVAELTKELGTIGNFITDKAILDKYDSVDCSLTITSLTTDVTAVKSNTQSYSVLGLAETNSNRATSILTAYDDFINLRLELQGITDVQSFDENLYTDKVNSVTHTLNKEELQGILETIKADKQVADAKANLDAASTEDEKAVAQKALDVAHALQTQTQQQLEEVQKKLEDVSKGEDLSTTKVESNVAETETK